MSGGTAARSIAPREAPRDMPEAPRAGLPAVSVVADEPTPLDLGELADLCRSYAEEVRTGCYEIHADPTDRWHVRIHADDRVDVWLISWTETQGTELHDHGRSAGAFTVVEGGLTESVWVARAGRLVHSERRAGETVAFGNDYVHDVRNTAEPTAVSVHAYSPPLTRMGFYDVDGDRLVRRAQAWTDDPETPAPPTERRVS